LHPHSQSGVLFIQSCIDGGCQRLARRNSLGCKLRYL